MPTKVPTCMCNNEQLACMPTPWARWTLCWWSSYRRQNCLSWTARKERVSVVRGFPSTVVNNCKPFPHWGLSTLLARQMSRLFSMQKQPFLNNWHRARQWSTKTGSIDVWQGCHCALSGMQAEAEWWIQAQECLLWGFSGFSLKAASWHQINQRCFP